MVKALEPYELTKAEKLQIVNLAPATPVELYVVRTLSVLPLLFRDSDSGRLQRHAGAPLDRGRA